MDQQQIRPGWWFTTEWAEVAPAGVQHERFRRGARRMGRSRPRLPQPPDGLAVAWGSPYSPSFVLYPVRRNAEQILNELRTLARAAGADDATLQRQVQTYTDWHSGRETAPGVAGILAGSTAEAQAERRRQAGYPDPGAFFLQSQRAEQAADAVRQFVARWGPLVVDFAWWLAAGERARVGRGHPAVEPLWASPLARLGADVRLWPEEWRGWAASILNRLSSRRDPPFLVPAPVGFYLWAAFMLTALHRHPQWPGCQLFLASRLSSMLLLPDTFLPSDPTDAEQSWLPTARPWGELLDYLALAAASPRQSDAPLRLQECPHCENTFAAADRRRRYCSKCSDPRVHAVMASRRYRAKRSHSQ